jgi:hypothetical protein
MPRRENIFPGWFGYVAKISTAENLELFIGDLVFVSGLIPFDGINLLLPDLIATNNGSQSGDFSQTVVSMCITFGEISVGVPDLSASAMVLRMRIVVVGGFFPLPNGRPRLRFAVSITAGRYARENLLQREIP